MYLENNYLYFEIVAPRCYKIDTLEKNKPTHLLSSVRVRVGWCYNMYCSLRRAENDIMMPFIIKEGEGQAAVAGLQPH